MDERETIVLTLRPLPSDTPVVVRVRSALKTLLRTYGLKCTNIGGDADVVGDDDEPADERSGS